jgi:hypothetical protein
VVGFPWRGEQRRATGRVANPGVCVPAEGCGLRASPSAISRKSLNVKVIRRPLRWKGTRLRYARVLNAHSVISVKPRLRRIQAASAGEKTWEDQARSGQQPHLPPRARGTDWLMSRARHNSPTS